MRQFRSMVYPYVVWIAIMIVVPMLMILLYAFTGEGNDVTTFRFTLENFGRFFSDAVFLAPCLLQYSPPSFASCWAIPLLMPLPQVRKKARCFGFS